MSTTSTSASAEKPPLTDHHQQSSETTQNSETTTSTQTLSKRSSKTRASNPLKGSTETAGTSAGTVTTTTPLLESITNGQWNEALSILSKNPNLANVSDQFGFFPLHHSVYLSAPVPLIKNLIRASPQALVTPDRQGKKRTTKRKDIMGINYFSTSTCYHHISFIPSSNNNSANIISHLSLSLSLFLSLFLYETSVSLSIYYAKLITNQ